MTLRDALRTLAEALPPGSAVPVPREQLLELLGGGGTGTPAGADLTVPQVAERFGKAPGTVRKWLAAGDFPGAYQVHGKEWRIPSAALQAFREKQQGESGELGDWRKELPA